VSLPAQAVADLSFVCWKVVGNLTPAVIPCWSFSADPHTNKEHQHPVWNQVIALRLRIDNISSVDDAL